MGGGGLDSVPPVYRAEFFLLNPGVIFHVIPISWLVPMEVFRF